VAVTPIIKKRGRGGGVTSESPKPNVFNASLRDRGEILVKPAEGHGISPFPNARSDGGIDGSLLIAVAVREPEVVKGGGGKVVEVVVEVAPDLLGTGQSRSRWSVSSSRGHVRQVAELFRWCLKCRGFQHQTPTK
jgi:hypothetical protein